MAQITEETEEKSQLEMTETEGLAPKKERKKRAKSGPSSDETGRPDRISIALTPDGRIDWAHMRAENSERVKALLEVNAPETRQPASDFFDDDQVSNLLALEGELKGLAFSLVKRVPPPVVAPAFTYNEKAQEALVPAAKRLINKYCPAAIGEKSELIGFVAVYIAVTKAQLSHANNLMLSYRMQVATRARAFEQARVAGRPTTVPPPPPSPPAAMEPQPSTVAVDSSLAPLQTDGESLDDKPTVVFEAALGAAGE